MKQEYILAIDQSTQGTKGLIFDKEGALIARADLAHRQLINERGWVEHDPMEILGNVLTVSRMAVEKAGIAPESLAAMGISNQRETVLAWDRASGQPFYNAIVWQCGRAKDICAKLSSHAAEVQQRTGIPLSPYFSAGKLAWILRNVPAAAEAARSGSLCCGTVDSWLVYNLTREHNFKTDYSNASRTQLFNIHELKWDETVCALFGVPLGALAEVCMSDSLFGHTDLGGWLERPIPICGVLGDSHAALLGQGCTESGMVKATYGTGSSVMMQTGARCIQKSGNLATSLAWGLGGEVQYVLEGNLNYTGAVITWLKKDMGLLVEDAESERLAREANSADSAYFVPAFTGLGAPYWDSEATALLTGITRTTGRAEMVKACLECIGYQITDLLRLMEADSGLELRELRADGGPTANAYLMQFQSDMAALPVAAAKVPELSGMGAAYAAGFACGLYAREAPPNALTRRVYEPAMSADERERRYDGWKRAVRQALYHE